MNTRYRDFVMCIAQIEKNIEKIKAYEMKPYGLQGMDVTLFVQLSLKEEGYSAAELSRECKMDKAAISRSIKKLERKGFVHTNKTYGSKITLSKEGKEISHRLETVIDSYIQKAELSDDKERKHFYEALHSISSSIEEVTKELRND